jgi:lantibiotic modifying enzyme
MDEVKLYYLRAGMWICLLDFLCGTDFHYGNIIASGEYPIPIDLETVFHPTPMNKTLSESSILGIKLLPFRFLNEEGKIEKDFSGLGMNTKLRKTLYRDLHTDKMKSVNKQTTPFSEHWVYCKRKKILPEMFAPPILTGFRTMYNKIRKDKNMISEWFDQVSCCPVRTILGSTRIYHRFLEMLQSPVYFFNTKEKSELLKKLEKNRAFSSPAIVREEQTALLQGDIPYFQSIPSSRGIYIGKKIIDPHFWDQTPYDIAKRRLEVTLEEHQHLQEKIIERTLRGNP